MNKKTTEIMFNGETFGYISGYRYFPKNGLIVTVMINTTKDSSHQHIIEDSLGVLKDLQAMDVNLKSAFLMSRAVIPSMKKQKYGKIIFTASTAASVGYANIAPYSATKGGLISMMKSMVAELGQYNINVNTLSPGSTVTEGNKLLENSDFLEIIRRRTASGSPMKPEDMTAAAVFLASEEASAVHGLDLIVDNAWCSN